MSRFVKSLADGLAQGMNARSAVDLFWALGRPEVYRELGVVRGWSPQRPTKGGVAGHEPEAATAWHHVIIGPEDTSVLPDRSEALLLCAQRSDLDVAGLAANHSASRLTSAQADSSA